jgi:DNA-binding PadR family transcriptional regulator
MKLLTRVEEYVLLAVLTLGDEAYSLSILDYIEKATHKKWTLGGIYIPLYRLEENGYLSSELGPPTKERGGKRKKYYRLTNKGKDALKTQKQIQMAMWEKLGKTALE